MPAFPDTPQWRHINHRPWKSTLYTLAFADAYVAKTPEARALVERAHTHYTEIVAGPHGVSLTDLATETLGRPHMWMVLAVVNRDIKDIVDDPCRLVPPGTVLRIPMREAPSKALASCTAELPPQEHASAYASHHSSTVQHPAQQRTSSPMQTMCNARIEHARAQARHAR